MRAAFRTQYGYADVLSVRDIAKPEPSKNQVLVRVRATTVNRTDWGMLEPHPFFVRLATGLFRPKLQVLGMDFAGEVEAVGSAVTVFKTGDRVFGMSPDVFGAQAEYLCVDEDGQIGHMPEDVSYSEAVVCEGAWYADSNLRWLNLSRGQSILIYGASGAIGVAALQLAKSRGAHVTAVVGTRHMELAKTLGADRVIDYTQEDFIKAGDAYDAIMDAVGKTSYWRCRKALKPDGSFVATDLGRWSQNIWLALWSRLLGKRRVAIPLPVKRADFVSDMAELLASGSLRAVIDRTYELAKIQEAYRYVQKGQKTGIVVVEIDQYAD